MTLVTDDQLPQTSFAVLGMLSFNPMSGYDLKQFADKSIGYFYWSPAKSQIYAELRRLKKAGLVSEDHVEQENRPDKRIYSLTHEGKKLLADWVGSPELERDIFKSSIMLRMFFGKAGNTGALIKLLEQNLESQKLKLRELREIEQFQLECPPEIDTTFTLVTVRGGIHLTNAAIAWTNESIASLQAAQSRQSANEGKST